jgi:3-oxoacyl-[acyl-carrier protein] reductase
MVFSITRSARGAARSSFAVCAPARAGVWEGPRNGPDTMSDLLLNPAARRLLGSLGLPIPLPRPLRRDAGAWPDRPLSGRITIVGASGSAECLGAIASGVLPAGIAPYLAVPDALRKAFRDTGAERRLSQPSLPALDALGEVAKPDALIFDATGIADLAGLRALYEFFHPLVGRLDEGGRAVVVAWDDAATPEAAAASAAVEGFVRSLAKEIGKIGATANLVRVARGAEARLGPVMRYVLSTRAAFVTGQVITVSAEAKAAEAIPFTKVLARKTALVTGAARGIGEATARALAQEGAHVICLDRPADEGPLRAVASAVSGTALLADLADASAPEKIAEALRERGVDVVVHNAGITRDKTLARMSPEQWDTVIDVNLAAVTRVHAAVEGLIKEGGRVVCLSSVAGLAGNVGQTAYAASKAGVAGWARATAGKLADRGITVNAVAPGFIETRLTAAMPVAIREAARRLSALAQGGTPEDVAQAITFLASPGAHGITGRTLRVCGGAFVGA